MNNKRLFHHNIRDINYIIHTRISQIYYDMKLDKYDNVFNKLDSDIIISYLNAQLQVQLKDIDNACVIGRTKTFDHFKRLYNYVTKLVGIENVNKIIDEQVEDYSLFKIPLFKMIFFIILYSIRKENNEIFFKIYMVYGIYIYTKIFEKFIPNCNPELLIKAVEIGHGSSLFLQKFKEGGHYEVIVYVITTESNKLIDLINTKKLKHNSLSRSISYIKSRFNQTIGNFANSAYYPLMNNPDKYKSVDPDQIRSEVNKTINTIEQIIKIDPAQIKSLFNNIQLNDKTTKIFQEIIINYIIPLDELLEKYETILSKSFYFIYNNNIDLKICSALFYDKFTKLFITKGKSQELKLIKQLLDDIIAYVANKEHINLSIFSKKELVYLRYIYARMLYMFYIREGNC